jgi:hypothetical protein
MGTTGGNSFSGDDGLTKLAFRFHASDDLGELSISIGQGRHLVLALTQKALQQGV